MPRYLIRKPCLRLERKRPDSSFERLVGRCSLFVLELDFSLMMQRTVSRLATLDAVGSVSDWAGLPHLRAE